MEGVSGTLGAASGLCTVFVSTDAVCHSWMSHTVHEGCVLVYEEASDAVDARE